MLQRAQRRFSDLLDSNCLLRLCAFAGNSAQCNTMRKPLLLALALTACFLTTTAHLQNEPAKPTRVKTRIARIISASRCSSSSNTKKLPMLSVARCNSIPVSRLRASISASRSSICPICPPRKKSCRPPSPPRLQHRSRITCSVLLRSLKTGPKKRSRRFKKCCASIRTTWARM